MKMEDDEFDELDYRSIDQYWSTDANNIGADSSISAENLAAALKPDFDQPPPLESPCQSMASYLRDNADRLDPSSNMGALKQLTILGFPQSECELELAKADLDIGLATVNLYRYLVIDPQGLFDKTSQQLDVAAETREEERTALQAIYEQNFCVLIKDRIWKVFLKLETLTKHLQSLKGRHLNYESSISNANTLETQYQNQRMKYCKFFTEAKGCRFGSKCMNRHVTLAQQMKEKDERILSKEEVFKTTCMYTLHVRITDHYPDRPAIVYLTSENRNLRPENLLKISAKLLQNCSMISAEYQEPTVYSCVSYLEDLDNYKDCL